MTTRTITLPADQWAVILEAVEDHTDEGPYGEGWKSSRLSAASAALSTALAQPEPEGPTDEELETTARAAEIQYMKEQGGLTASTPNGIHAQLQAQRLAGLRAVATRSALAQPGTERVVAKLGQVLRERHGGSIVADWLEGMRP